MVKARKPAANQLAASPSTITEKIDRPRPKASAASGSTRPEGTGRVLVRDMRASISASYHMLSAPDAPAPTAIARIETMARTGFIVPGATTMPVTAVRTTSDMTRGLRSARKSFGSERLSRGAAETEPGSIREVSISDTWRPSFNP